MDGLVEHMKTIAASLERQRAGFQAGFGFVPEWLAEDERWFAEEIARAEET